MRFLEKCAMQSWPSRKSHPDLPFIIDTGKPFAATSDIQRPQPDTFPLHHPNGCLIYRPNDANDGTTLDWAENLETDFVRQVVRENQKRQIGTFVYAMDEVFEVVLGGCSSLHIQVEKDVTRRRAHLPSIRLPMRS
ncbi:uncharacterized protein EV422DRAFT_275213 [Fimicolochytrium jonesii]|uniref:uncharacterized protein n=1 Tax=Fimicolochytrium jonesii TaxID=1396493 RepID=UPI0022FE7E0F|nr:uncharacterized protein EV422DRAFT_275213 [Fimicolochytrium jonesii]KAI8816684.1 hypothetical protein EV422DRAFT_275213 [Fimicolochytrium jonesii]